MRSLWQNHSGALTHTFVMWLLPPMLGSAASIIILTDLSRSEQASFVKVGGIFLFWLRVVFLLTSLKGTLRTSMAPAETFSNLLGCGC